MHQLHCKYTPGSSRFCSDNPSASLADHKMCPPILHEWIITDEDRTLQNYRLLNPNAPILVFQKAEFSTSHWATKNGHVRQ